MKTTKKTTKKTTTKAVLDFNPVQVIHQYRETQKIGESVCRCLSALFKPPFDFHFREVRTCGNELQIAYDCVWMTVPVNVFVQGVAAIVAYAETEHRKQIDERRKEQEIAEKARIAQQEQNELDVYKRLRAKFEKEANAQTQRY